MLRKDIDYVPQSPQNVSRSSASRQSRSLSKLQIKTGSEDDCRLLGQPIPEHISEYIPVTNEKSSSQKDRIRTTEEKKELLGTMLGNVDALVEGVRKAGIWGLG